MCQYVGQLKYNNISKSNRHLYCLSHELLLIPCAAETELIVCNVCACILIYPIYHEFVISFIALINYAPKMLLTKLTHC